MDTKITVYGTAIAFVCLGIITSCQSTNSENGNNSNTDTTSQTSSDAFEDAKVIFYSLPSPIETATAVESLGIKYSNEYLNSPKNINRYNTTGTQALNLGCYIADMSFCILYNQNQASIDYLACIKKLSGELGVSGFFSDSTMRFIQENMNNKKLIINSVSKSYTNSTTFLEENQRNEIAAMIIVGGWLESVYLSVMMLEKTDNYEDKMYETVINQKFTLDDLLGFLKSLDKDKDIKNLSTQLEGLKVVYDKIDDKVDKAALKEIGEKTTSIRNSFVQ